MIPDRFQYFLDDFCNFENLVKIWTRRPPNYHKNILKIQDKYGIIFKTYYFVISQLSGTSIFKFGPSKPILFDSVAPPPQNKNLVPLSVFERLFPEYVF